MVIPFYCYLYTSGVHQLCQEVYVGVIGKVGYWGWDKAFLASRCELFRIGVGVQVSEEGYGYYIFLTRGGVDSRDHTVLLGSPLVFIVTIEVFVKMPFSLLLFVRIIQTVSLSKCSGYCNRKFFRQLLDLKVLGDVHYEAYFGRLWGRLKFGYQ